MTERSTACFFGDYSYFGDADLNGVVDTGQDFDLYLQGLSSGGTLGGWLYGDFDYNGVVDSGQDFDLFLAGLTAQSGGSLLTAGLREELYSRVQTAINAIPEPSTWLMGSVGLIGLTGWRLRRQRRVTLAQGER